MDANFKPASILPSNSKDGPQTEDQTKMVMRHITYAAEAMQIVTRQDTNMEIGSTSYATEVKSPAKEIAPQKVDDLPRGRKRAMVSCEICGEQGHNQRPCFKSFKQSSLRHY
ncbi:hypothetical protein QL285_086676 [Trifolium repens]|nr:hypothetical protein QL285_086676 [Trifolium repens]